MIHKLSLSLFALFSFGCWFSCPNQAVAAEKPNVIFVIFDDLNDWVNGFGGHPQTQTPNLDRLRARGVTFTNNHCTATLCAPSRPSMLTGLYPHTAAYFGTKESEGYSLWYENPVYAKAKTWPAYFLSHGYDVYHAGKIYHQRQVPPEASRPEFTEYGVKQHFGPYANTPDKKYPGQEYRGKEAFCVSLAEIPPGGWSQYNEPFKYVDDENRDEMPDELSAAYAAKKLSDRSRTKPFMLNIGIHRPHQPLTLPQKYFDRFPLDTLQLATIKADDLDDCARSLVYTASGAKIEAFTGYEKIVANGHLPLFTQAYLASVNFADEQLGKILDALDASVYADNTYVVITSDHGFHLGEKNYFFKNTLWEESTRVPLIIAGPGIGGGGRVSRPVSTVDIYPTLLELCGFPNKPHPNVALDGHSLVPLLVDPVHGVWAGPSVALTTMVGPAMKEDRKSIGTLKTDPTRQVYSVRSERYRYILCPNGEEELYDHEIDPNEWTNLASAPEQAAIKQELRAQMETLVKVRFSQVGR